MTINTMVYLLMNHVHMYVWCN